MIWLESWYETSLRPVFGEELQIIHQRDDFAHIILDGGREEFFLTLYGPDHLRLYWCNECFIFDRQRDLLVSSDTFGEIVFEGEVDTQKLPQMAVGLILQLKDTCFLGKEERVIGKTPSGYDERKEYLILAKTDRPRAPYRLSNILFRFIPSRQTF